MSANNIGRWLKVAFSVLIIIAGILGAISSVAAGEGPFVTILSCITTVCGCMSLYYAVDNFRLEGMLEVYHEWSDSLEKRIGKVGE